MLYKHFSGAADLIALHTLHTLHALIDSIASIIGSGRSCSEASTLDTFAYGPWS
jgi:hypothetical protein